MCAYERHVIQDTSQIVQYGPSTYDHAGGKIGRLLHAGNPKKEHAHRRGVDERDESFLPFVPDQKLTSVSLFPQGHLVQQRPLPGLGESSDEVS